MSWAIARSSCFWGQRAVIRDVVGLADRAIVVQGEQQAADDIGDVHERHGVVTRADDDSASRAQPVCHLAEVQVITWPEDLIRADDHGGQVILGDHPLDEPVAFGLGDRVRIRERREREALIGGAAKRDAVDAGGAHVDEAAGARGERGRPMFSVPVTFTAR